MSLKIALKPNERMIIGGAVISNGGPKCDLIVENRVPLLREKDIYNEDDANTPGKSIYFAIQLMYIDRENLATHHNTYWKIVREFVKAAPSSLGLIDQINELIVKSKYYAALKLAKNLIDFEEEMIERV